MTDINLSSFIWSVADLRLDAHTTMSTQALNSEHVQLSWGPCRGAMLEAAGVDPKREVRRTSAGANYGADTPTERREEVVEAAGVEREKREIGNLLMARDFWG